MQLPKSVTHSKIQQIDTLVIDNNSAKAEISLFGGQVLSFSPKKDNRSRIWLSEKAIFDRKVPIRGGIPICWPWFSNDYGQSDQKLPSHGFLRTQDWVLISCDDTQAGTLIKLTPSDANVIGFNYQVEVILEILVGESLVIKLTTVNNDTQDIKLNCAFHSYFSVSDIQQVQLKGIDGKYLDKLQAGADLNTPTPYLFNNETDRIHLCQSKQVEIVETHSSTSIKSAGHDSLVVWNPWLETSQKMKDMSEVGFKTMLCVETASTQWTRLKSGQSHTLVQEIS